MSRSVCDCVGVTGLVWGEEWGRLRVFVCACIRCYVGACISRSYFVPHDCSDGKATGDVAYTTLGKLGDAYIRAKKTGGEVEEKAESDYNAYATRLRRELVWQVSSSRIQGSHVVDSFSVL